jgi:hypothetical protein
MQISNPLSPEKSFYLTLLMNIQNKDYLLELEKSDDIIIFNPDYVINLL